MLSRLLSRSSSLTHNSLSTCRVMLACFYCFCAFLCVFVYVSGDALKNAGAQFHHFSSGDHCPGLLRRDIHLVGAHHFLSWVALSEQKRSCNCVLFVCPRGKLRGSQEASFIWVLLSLVGAVNTQRTKPGNKRPLFQECLSDYWQQRQPKAQI